MWYSIDIRWNMEVIHVDQYHPSKQQFDKVIKELENGNLVVLPTDTYYCVCALASKSSAVKMLTHFQHALGKERPLTFLCASISQASELMQVDNMTYRVLNAVVPAAVTFLLDAQQKTLKRYKMKSRDQIGVRIPRHNLIHQIIEACSGSLVCQPVENIEQAVDKQNLIEDYASIWLKTHYGCENQPSTIIDMTSLPPRLIRRGLDFEKIVHFINE